MRFLLLFSLVQVLNALDVSNLIPKNFGNNSPCKSCKVLVESFEKVMSKTILFYFLEW